MKNKKIKSFTGRPSTDRVVEILQSDLNNIQRTNRLLRILCVCLAIALVLCIFISATEQTFAYPNGSLFIVDGVDKDSLLSWVRSEHPYSHFRDWTQPYEDGAYSFLGCQVFTEYRLGYYIEWVHDENDWIDLHIRFKETEWIGADAITSPYNGIITDVISLDTSYSSIVFAYGDWYTLPTPQNYLNLRNFSLPSDDSSFQLGYDAGYVEGLTKGYGDAYSEQYEQMANSLEEGGNIGQGAIGGFMSGVSSMFSTVLNGVSVAGVSLLSVVASILMIVLCVYLVKVFKG